MRLLRQLGLSLAEIGRALDDPAWNLRAALDHHRHALDRRLADASRLRTRLVGLLASLEDSSGSASQSLIAMEDMSVLDGPVQQRISILVYADVRRAYDYLIDVFALTAGVVTTDGDGQMVHAEVHAGDGVVWLHPETSQFGLASAHTVGAATATMAVMVDDVDEHHRRARVRGADVVYEPVDQPYGYREYSARDCEGGLWSFMKTPRLKWRTCAARGTSSALSTHSDLHPAKWRRWWRAPDRRNAPRAGGQGPLSVRAG